ncbi:MAG: hypothetical protein MUF64_25365 [Polyangiaceae bacterium]|jgi:hypothetical protein|nr:hypothetical protein [Polyangiaceae bacterium]
MARMSRRRWMGMAGVLFTLAGCASPTLPLPPPERPEISTFHDDGTITLKGSALPEALVYGFNQNLEEGLIVKASPGGGYEMRIRAEVGHDISLWQELSTERSPSLLIRVRKP